MLFRSARRLAWAALASSLLACSGTSATTGVPPVTGVVVRAETVTAGLGCGRGDGEVFKYAAVVLGRGPGGAFDQPVAAGVYDCFANAAFVELPLVGGSNEYEVQVYAFNERAYLASQASIDASTAGDPAGAAASIATLRAASPTWTTTCSATQIEDVQALAVCAPVASSTASTSAP